MKGQLASETRGDTESYKMRLKALEEGHTTRAAGGLLKGFLFEGF